MIGVFDTETDSPDPTDARIISAFVGLLDDDGQLISAEEYLLQPDRPIPAEATAIHGTCHPRSSAFWSTRRARK